MLVVGGDEAEVVEGLQDEPAGGSGAVVEAVEPDHVGGSAASARWSGSSQRTPAASTRVRPSVHSAGTPRACLTYG